MPPVPSIFFTPIIWHFLSEYFMMSLCFSTKERLLLPSCKQNHSVGLAPQWPSVLLKLTPLGLTLWPTPSLLLHVVSADRVLGPYTDLSSWGHSQCPRLRAWAWFLHSKNTLRASCSHWALRHGADAGFHGDVPSPKLGPRTPAGDPGFWGPRALFLAGALGAHDPPEPENPMPDCPSARVQVLFCFVSLAVGVGGLFVRRRPAH